MNYKNTRKKQFLSDFPEAHFDSESCNHPIRSKLNFSYFDRSQPSGQDFSDWTHDQLKKLLNKLVEYGKKPLSDWTNEKVGKGSQHVLEIYGSFPSHSDFRHPKHIPKDVQWARFRLESDMRLIGFVIPESLNAKESKQSNKFLFCTNTFYVVFLDKNHKFYKSTPRK